MASAVVGQCMDLECRQVNKAFGALMAVDDISFAIPRGSFFSILGPSGCGKTTLLRLLAGFQQPDSGDILIKGKSVLGTPPNRRPLNMVFQHLALFPHLSVADNVAYGLRRRRVGRSERETRVRDMLARVGLPDSGDKSVSQLSGGQKQRVAIARCLVLDPDVLLLDEPLGALDLKLREQMKVELKELQRKFEATFVYITHDQSEALVMSDQVAVMRAGRFEQMDSPQALYYQPATPFVAGFVGESNRWAGRIIGQQSGSWQVRTDAGFTLKVDQQSQAATLAELRPDADVELFLRPESIALHLSGSTVAEDNHYAGQVESLLFDGARSQVLVQLPGQPPVSVQVALPQTPAFRNLKKGDSVTLSWSARDILCYAG